ncbi:MAG: hypothetical protein KIT63_22110 [Rhodoferax sp.]|nr:hypothetical protein [Rhodoferax sp.]
MPDLIRWPGTLHGHGHGPRRTLAVVLVLLCTGCALAPPAPAPADPVAPEGNAAHACAHWYLRLDEAVAQAEVRDAAASPVPGHRFLRVDRYHASLRDRLPVRADAPTAASVRAALMARLLALDLQARGHEIANLPQASRSALAELAQRPATVAGLVQHTRTCGQVLLQSALARPARAHASLQALAVAPDYVPAYRVLGLYPVTRIPFLYGVRRFEDATRAVFRQDPPPDTGTPRQLLVPPSRPSPEQVTPERLRAMLQPAAHDPLGIPAPTPAQQEILFAHFAPSFMLGIRSDDDRAGALRWPAQPPSGTPPVPDIARPVIYRQLAWTRHGKASLLQLVYTVWFGGRTPTSWPIDLLAGRLDGLVWRVTLSSDGVPLMYDSIHPCGCYHQFFPPPWVRPRPAPDPHAEWAFSPAPAPRTVPGHYLVLGVAPVTHYLTRLEARPPADGTPYAWQDYDRLRSLPTSEGPHRSVFDPHGFIPGTDRAEAWLFWPMGIARAGSMRQWGRHATAFVGRRHFDDARLLDERFVLDPPPRDD